MTKKITLITSFLLIAIVVYCQKNKEELTDEMPKTKIRYLEFGIGVPNIYFRDKTSSSLAYKGTGLSILHFAGSKQNATKMYRDWNLNVSLQNAKPDIKNVTDWNKPATIFGIDFMYRKLKGINIKPNSKWRFFAGASLGSNLQFATIPSANNSFAYNFSWIQLGLEGMLKRDFTVKGKKIQITNQTSLPILGINVRPLSYVGLLPEEVIWSQDLAIFASVFKHPKLFSLHNNIALKNDIGLDLLLRKSKLGVRYCWQYQHNTVSVNSLNSINTSISINYSIQLKNK